MRRGLAGGMLTSPRTDAIADRIFENGQHLAVQVVYDNSLDRDVLALLQLQQAAGRSRVHTAIAVERPLPRQVPIWRLPYGFKEDRARRPEAPLVGGAFRIF